MKALIVSAVVLVVFGLLFVGIVTISVKSSERACGRTGEAMELQSKFNMSVGCMIKTRSGQWVKLEQFRVVE